MLEVVTATILSISALFAAVFSTDWILSNNKEKHEKYGKKDSTRPGVYAFNDIMAELDRKRMQNGNKSPPPEMPPEREYRNSAQVVDDFNLIMAALDASKNNGKKKESSGYRK